MIVAKMTTVFMRVTEYAPAESVGIQISHHVLLPCPAYAKDRLQRCDGALRLQDVVLLRPLES